MPAVAVQRCLEPTRVNCSDLLHCSAWSGTKRMRTLKYCYGDFHAVKACIALAASEQEVELYPTSERTSISLELENKTVLTDPNAIARIIGESSVIFSPLCRRSTRSSFPLL